MEFEKVKQWLDDLVDTYKRMNELSTYNEVISTCIYRESIQLFRCIDIVADIMGIKLEEKYTADREYPFEYSFEYRGCKFNQLSQSRLSNTTY